MLAGLAFLGWAVLAGWTGYTVLILATDIARSSAKTTVGTPELPAFRQLYNAGNFIAFWGLMLFLNAVELALRSRARFERGAWDLWSWLEHWQIVVLLNDLALWMTMTLAMALILAGGIRIFRRPAPGGMRPRPSGSSLSGSSPSGSRPPSSRLTVSSPAVPRHTVRTAVPHRH